MNGERLAWDGIGRFKLRDGRVIDAIGGAGTPPVIQAALASQPAA